jgi:hypothetical protein
VLAAILLLNLVESPRTQGTAATRRNVFSQQNMLHTSSILFFLAACFFIATFNIDQRKVMLVLEYDQYLSLVVIFFTLAVIDIAIRNCDCSGESKTPTAAVDCCCC